jgi:CheY-like chemotaxis protein
VVDSFENPTLALEKFKAHSYDLAVLDIKMPDLNGFALYRDSIKGLRFVLLRLVKYIMTNIQIYFLQYLTNILFENQLIMNS